MEVQGIVIDLIRLSQEPPGLAKRFHGRFGSAAAQCSSRKGQLHQSRSFPVTVNQRPILTVGRLQVEKLPADHSLYADAVGCFLNETRSSPENCVRLIEKRQSCEHRGIFSIDLV